MGAILFSFNRMAAVALLITTLLLLSAARPAGAATPHKRRHSAANESPANDDNDDATPAPSSSPGRSKHHHAVTSGDDSPGTQEDAAAGFHPPSAIDKHGDAADKPGHPATAPAKPNADDTPRTNPVEGAAKPAATSALETSDLRDFDAQPEPVRNLLKAALDLTHQNLTYAYGSANPSAGGMDCSGTMYYLLKNAGFEEVPRSASEQYAWVRKQARFYAVLSKKEDSFELNEMRPGDLLFWTGTYKVDHDPPVTHTMLYLGRRKKDGKALMMGASDGRPYDGERRNGVSVFDFKLPAARSGDSADASTAAAPDHSPDFAGYGPVPGMAERNDAAARQTAAAAKAK